MTSTKMCSLPMLSVSGHLMAESQGPTSRMRRSRTSRALSTFKGPEIAGHARKWLLLGVDLLPLSTPWMGETY